MKKMTESALIVMGATAHKEPDVLPKKLRGVYVPKAETPVHKAMYEYYKSLGKSRSIPKVAHYFGKSVPFVSTLSRAFRWGERLYDQSEKNIDPVVRNTAGQMDSSRTKIAGFVSDIADTLFELSDLSKKIKSSPNGETEDDKKKAGILIQALHVFGVSVRTPKDLRDLISVLKDIQDFKSDVTAPPPGKTTMTIEKAIIIKDLE